MWCHYYESIFSKILEKTPIAHHFTWFIFCLSHFRCTSQYQIKLDCLVKGPDCNCFTLHAGWLGFLFVNETWRHLKCKDAHGTCISNTLSNGYQAWGQIRICICFLSDNVFELYKDNRNKSVFGFLFDWKKHICICIFGKKCIWPQHWWIYSRDPL